MRTESSSDHSVSIVAKHGVTSALSSVRVLARSQKSEAAEPPKHCHAHLMLRKLLLKSGMTFQMRYAQPLRMQVGLRTVRRGLVSARLEATHLTTAKRRLQSFTSKLMKRLRSCSRWQGFQSLRGPPLRPFKRCIKRTRLTKSTLQI